MALRVLPAMLKKMSEREIRSLYSKQRSIANKRITRLHDAGYGKGAEKFPTIKELGNVGDIGAQLLEVSKFIDNPKTTVSGIKKYVKNEIQRYHDDGFTFINEKNIFDFYSFMENMRDRYSAKIFDSGSAIDVFNETQRLKIPVEDLQKHFEYYLENMDTLEELKPTEKNTEKYANISRRIKRYK